MQLPRWWHCLLGLAACPALGAVCHVPKQMDAKQTPGCPGTLQDEMCRDCGERCVEGWNLLLMCELSLAKVLENSILMSLQKAPEEKHFGSAVSAYNC